MSSMISDILAELGWQDGFQIPVSNLENRELEQEVAKLSLQKAKAKTAFEASTQKLQNLESHMKFVNQESEENQNLLTAHSQQYQVQENALKLAEAEKAKLEQEIRSAKKKIGESAERQNLKKAQLEKSALKLEKLKSETDWDAEALKAWEESLQKREDNNELIKKFSKEDERKYNELEAKRQHLEVEYAERRQTIEKMVSDLTNYERILDRTGKTMRQQLIERNALIQQWKDSVRILQQRDNDINKLQNKLFNLSEVVDSQKEKLEDQNNFYQMEIRNNEEIELETQQLNTLNSKMKRELAELGHHILLLNSQADTLRRQLVNTAKHLEEERAIRKNFEMDTNKHEQRVKTYQDAIAKLKHKLEDIRTKTGSSTEERIQALQKLIDYEQKQEKILINDDKILQTAYYRCQQTLQEQINFRKSKHLTVFGMQANIKHLRKHNEEQKNNINKQKEGVYELDFKIDEVHGKIFILENATYNVDKDELEAKFAELESQMSEHIDVKNLLKDQVNKIQDDMRRLTTTMAADEKQLLVLQDKLLHQQLSFEGGQKQLAAIKSTIQQKQVEESILLLRLNQVNKAMKKEKQNMCNLEKLKLHVAQATKSRMVEIEAHKDILMVRRRNLIEDRGRLKADISARHIRMEQFQKRYTIVLTSLGKDESGEALTVTYFKVKNAQEKFLLQNEGDELDNKIKKAEQEIVAMENTLKVVNLTNVKFKHSLDAIDENSGEMNEMQKLENEILNLNFALRQKRKEFAKKQQLIIDLKPLLEDNKKIQDQEAISNQNLSEDFFKAETEKMNKELQLQKTEERLKSYEKRVSKEEVEKYEKNLEIVAMKEANNSIEARLWTLSSKEPDPNNNLISKCLIDSGFSIYDRRSLSTLSLQGTVRSSKSTSSTSRSTLHSGSEKSSATMSKVVIKFEA